MSKALTHQHVVSLFDLIEITPGLPTSPKYTDIFGYDISTSRFSVAKFPQLEHGQCVLAMVDQMGIEDETTFKYYECKTIQDMQAIIRMNESGQLQTYKFFVGKLKM